LVTDEPGIGKSTLLTHLSNETRKSHPDVWIVRVNINNYTRILKELKTNGCEDIGAITLLTAAAQVKETDGLDLERRLFGNCCSSTGNIAVLIDGVDEVSPLYTKQVEQMLEILIKPRLKNLVNISKFTKFNEGFSGIIIPMSFLFIGAFHRRSETFSSEVLEREIFGYKR
jgi:hypothetical protein